MKILADLPPEQRSSLQVIPLRAAQLWGSFFSHASGKGR